jgi:hypothetical protein
MPVSSPKLASRIQARLAPHMPPGLQLRRSGGRIALVARGEVLATIRAPEIAEDPDERSGEEKVLAAALATLAGIQDAVMHEVGGEWPTGARGDVGLPTCRIADGDLLCLFRLSDDEVVLLLPPIPLTELT